METLSLLSFSKQISHCSCLISLIDWISCDLASSFKFLRTVSQTHWVICCQITKAFLQTAGSGWKHTHTHAHGVNEHMFVIHICSYLATNQRPCHTRGVHYFSQCHTWVCFTRDCLCVFWQPAREYTWQLTGTWQHVTLLARFDCSTSTHTQVCVCVCVTWSLSSLSPLFQRLLEGAGWLLFIKDSFQQRAVLFLSSFLILHVNTIIQEQHLKRDTENTMRVTERVRGGDEIKWSTWPSFHTQQKVVCSFVFKAFDE